MSDTQHIDSLQITLPNTPFSGGHAGASLPTPSPSGGQGVFLPSELGHSPGPGALRTLVARRAPYGVGPKHPRGTPPLRSLLPPLVPTSEVAEGDSAGNSRVPVGVVDLSLSNLNISYSPPDA